MADQPPLRQPLKRSRSNRSDGSDGSNQSDRPRKSFRSKSPRKQGLQEVQWRQDSYDLRRQEAGGSSSIILEPPEPREKIQYSERDYTLKQSTDINDKKLSSLDDIKTLEDLLQFVPSKYHDTIIDADHRARRAFNKSANKEKKSPKDLISFVESYYDVERNKRINWMEYRFKSLEHKKSNDVIIYIEINKGILNSGFAYRLHKDEVHFSDLQHYACITNGEKKILINEYHADSIMNENTLKIVKALYCASINLNPDRDTNGVLNLTRESAAFIPFLGAEVNTSIAFLAEDLGLNIQSVAIERANKEMITFQLKFTPARSSQNG